MTTLLILNGASCAGKSTTAERLASRLPSAEWIHPDGLWNDTPKISSETIFERVLALAVDSAMKELIIVDCQIRPQSARLLLSQSRIAIWTSVLIDCSDTIREARMYARGWRQEEFEKIAHWAAVLRKETYAHDHPVIDSSSLSVDAVVDGVAEHLTRLNWLT